jgi:oligopeptide transport system substrate-binding protein
VKHRLARILEITLCLSMLFCLAACGKTGATTKKAAKKTDANLLRYGIQATPPNVDPTNLYDINAYSMVRQCYEGLTDRDEEGKISAGLATSWNTPDNGLTWHFVLAKDVKFHSGKTLTAKDVKFTFERALSPKSKGDGATYLADITGADAITKGKSTDLTGFEILNDNEFNIHFQKADMLFPEACSIECLYIVDRSVVEGKGNSWWEKTSAGTGPFMLTKYAEDDKLVMKAFDGYRKGKPAISGIEFDIVKEDSTLLEMYKNGDLDIIGAPTSKLKTIRSDAKLSAQLKECTSADINYLGMNAKLYKPFADQRVREAVSLVINRKDIAEKIMANTAKPLYGIVPVGFTGYSTDAEQQTSYDVNKAKALLKAAGYSSSNPLPQVTLDYLGVDEDNAAYIANQLKNELGWNVKLENPDRSTLLNGLFDKKYAFFIWGCTADFGDEYTIADNFATDAMRNFGNYSSKQYDALMEKASQTSDADARIQLYRQAEKILVLQDFGYVPLYTDVSFLLVKPNVSGVKYGCLGLDCLGGVSVSK